MPINSLMHLDKILKGKYSWLSPSLYFIKRNDLSVCCVLFMNWPVENRKEGKTKKGGRLSHFTAYHLDKTA